MKDILDAAGKGEKYAARMDQFAAPASVALYVDFLVKAIERNAKGTFHITPRGRTSRYEFAAKILEYAGYDPATVFVPETDPKRPRNVVLESLMLEMLGADLPTWEEGSSLVHGFGGPVRVWVQGAIVSLRSSAEREGRAGIACAPFSSFESERRAAKTGRSCLFSGVAKFLKSNERGCCAQTGPIP